MLKFGSNFVYNAASDSEDDGDEIIDEADLEESFEAFSLAAGEATVAVNALPAAEERAAAAAGGGGPPAPPAAAAAAAAAAPAVPPMPQVRVKAKKRAATRGRAHRRQVDTNVLSLALASLATDSELATGDAHFCEQCSAALSAASSLTPAGAADEFNWGCEFCGHANSVFLDPAEVPREGAHTVDFLIAPPPAAALARQQSADEAPIVFVCDTSGSMCITQEAPHDLQLRGDRRDELAGLRQAGDGDQYLPGEARDITWVSRLQCVQAAVAAQLEALGESRRVALVTFNSQVTIVGDGSAAEHTVEGDRLNDVDQLLALGREHAPSRPLSETKAALTEKVWSLQENGQTALGPAMAVALGMVERARGAKIVLCTDGLANIGCGSMDPDDFPAAEADERLEEASLVYSDLGERARAAGVVVDVIGVEGANCDLENLGAMAEHTAGSVTRVDPVNLTRDFAGVLANPVIATEVRATLLLHAGLAFRGEATATNKLAKDIGNATAESEVSFEYLVKSRAEREALGFGSLEELPFQVQIAFTDKQGAQKMRVVTQSKPVTRRRAQAQADADMAVLGAHVAQTCAGMAAAGDYGSSRVTARAWTNMLGRCAEAGDAEQAQSYQAFVQDLGTLDGCLAQAQAQDRAAGFSDSDSEGDNDDEEAEGKQDEGAVAGLLGRLMGKKAARGARRKKARARNDDLSTQLYSFKQKTASSYR